MLSSKLSNQIHKSIIAEFYGLIGNGKTIIKANYVKELCKRQS